MCWRNTDEVGFCAATLSFHLKELTHAGMVKPCQEGWFIYYSPDFKAMNSLVTAYLTGRTAAEESPSEGIRSRRRTPVCKEN